MTIFLGPKICTMTLSQNHILQTMTISFGMSILYTNDIYKNEGHDWVYPDMHVDSGVLS